MLLKMLKYDLKSVWRVAFVLSLVAIGASVISGVCYKTYYYDLQNNVISPFYLVVLLGFATTSVTAITSVSVISIIVYLRFYKHLFTDEGYLTFTLPVSRRTVLFSKTLNTVIWSVYQIILMIACIFVFSLFVPWEPEFNDVAEGFGNVLDLFFSIEYAGLWGEISAVCTLLALALLGLGTLCLVQLCIALASMLVRKGKLIIGILLYTLISGAVETAAQTVLVIESVIGEALIETLAVYQIYSAAVSIVNLLFSAGLVVLIYSLTQKIINKKLNLA